MKEYSYTQIVDDIEISKAYYKQFFGWRPEYESSDFVFLDTKSPLKFSLISKHYLFHNIELEEGEASIMSYCSWLYDSKDEMEEDKALFVSKGLERIEGIGCFLKDKSGLLWELRVRGELL